MAEVVVTDIEIGRLSAAGLKVMKAVLTYASAHKDVGCHELSLDDLSALAGLGNLSGEAMRALLYEGQGALARIEVVDTDSRTRDGLPFKSSPLLGYVGSDDFSVTFEVFDFVLQDAVLNKILALRAPMK